MIIYSNLQFAVVDKPYGAVSEHAGEDSLPHMIARELGIPPESVYVVHRLDRTTEGLMVYALTKSAAAELSRAVTDGRFEKTYRALITADDSLPQEGVMEDYLFFDRTRQKSFSVGREKKSAKFARLSYKLGESYHMNGVTVTPAAVKLETGRTHQIRAQFAARKSPLIGDGKYGSRVNYKGCALRSVKIGFEFHGEWKEFGEESEIR